MTLDLLLVLLLQILLLLTLLLTLMLQLVLLTLMLQLVLQPKFLKNKLILLQKLIPLNQLAQFHHLHAPQDIIQTLMEIVSQMSVLQKSSLMEKKLAKLVIFQMDKADV